MISRVFASCGNNDITNTCKAIETLKEIGMVVEGINALVAAKELSEKYNVEMPIVNGVYSIIYQGVNPKVAVSKLFNRTTKAE